MTDTTTAPAAEAPRHLAGPGAPDTALDVLRAAGWQLEATPEANVFAYGPDGRAVAAFLPEGDAFAPAANGWDRHTPLWVIRTYTDAGRTDVEWEATFTPDTPAEIIAAMLADMTRNAPLDPDRY